MKRNSFAFSVGVVLFSGIIACTKGPSGNTGPAGPAYTGAINGHIQLYDQYGDRLDAGYNLIQVTLKGGRNTSGDNNGYFLFDSVVTANYSIAAEGSGYGSTLINNVQFINDTLYQDVKLSAIPNFSITQFTAANSFTNYTNLTIKLTADPKPRNVIIFVSNNRNVNNTPSGYLLSYVVPIAAQQQIATLQVLPSDLNAAGILYPDEAYYAAYSYVVNDASVYEDEATGKNVYNAVSNPIIDSAAIP